MKNLLPSTLVSISIRGLETIDLPAMTKIHQAAFPDAALTRLGAETVRLYYEWQMCGPHESVSIGAFSGTDMVGFCVGGVFKGAVSGFVKRNRKHLIMRVVAKPWLLFSGEFRDRMASGIKALLTRSTAPRKPSAATPPSVMPSSFGILAICTHPQVQGGGAGKALMAAAERIASERGFSKMNLSVHPSNIKAAAFYDRLGWLRTPPGAEWRGAMYKILDTNSK